MKTYKLTESYPAPGSCRTSAIFYYIDGKRVSNHEHALAWLAANKAGKLRKQPDTLSKRGRLVKTWISLCINA